MNIYRKDLIQQLIDKGYTKKAAKAFIDDFASLIMDNLGEGNTISIRNFGCFDLLERKARSCPNPQTGEKIEVPAHWIPRFYPSKNMKIAVKMWEDNTKRGLA